MQDQGKRLLLAVALALGVMLVWNMVFSPDKKPAPPAGTTTTANGVTVGPTVATSLVGVALDPALAPAPAALPASLEPNVVLTFPKFVATFSPIGGNLVSFKLTDKRYVGHGKKSAHPDGELLGQLDGARFPGTFAVDFASSTYVLPANAVWTSKALSATVLQYSISTPTLDVTKTFTLLPESYLVKLAVAATVKVPAGQIAEQTLAVSVYALQDPARIEGAKGQGDARAWVSSSLVGDSIRHSPVTSVVKAPRMEHGITWTGFEHPYLLAAYAPRTDGKQLVDKWTYIDPAAPGLMRTDLEFPTEKLTADKNTITREVVGYLGPKNFKTLEAADEISGFNTNFRHTVDLGWFAFIGKPLLWLLLKFYAALGNWGLAIILLTFLVKAATIYWTTKSMRSMKAMAALAPQMKILQEKYKDDKQRQQVETMALYKTHGVNPIAGCLPILLQMPIWLALYRMLSSAGELYQQPFIGGWIDDLTSTDPFHILPFILVITMFAQARLTPATGDSMQQKMMQYGMPLMFGVMSFFFPAGLTLYIFTNTILSALHSVYMNKFDKQSLALVEKMKAASAGATGGKASGKPAAKPVIDAASSEVDSDDDDGDDSATAGGSSSSSAARPRNNNKRNNKKKRR